MSRTYIILDKNSSGNLNHIAPFHLQNPLIRKLLLVFTRGATIITGFESRYDGKTPIHRRRGITEPLILNVPGSPNNIHLPQLMTTSFSHICLLDFRFCSEWAYVLTLTQTRTQKFTSWGVKCYGVKNMVHELSTAKTKLATTVFILLYGVN